VNKENSVCKFVKMSVAPTIVRTKPKLSDYLFEQDKTKFKLPKKSSRPWVINNANDKNKLKEVLKDNLVTDFENIVSIHRGADPGIFLDKSLETGKGSRNESTRYLNCAQGNSENIVTSDKNDMANTNKTYRKQNLKHSSSKLDYYAELNPKSSTKGGNYKTNYQANARKKFEMQHIEEEESEEDRIKRQLLERDIELEYQQQVNKMFNSQQSAHLLHQGDQGYQSMQFHQQQNQCVYPPLYLQGPQGLYCVFVPPPESSFPEYPGSTGDMSETEGSDDGESLQDVSEEPMRNLHDSDWSNVSRIEEDLSKITLKNHYEKMYDISEDVSEEVYSTKNDEELTNLVLSIISE